MALGQGAGPLTLIGQGISQGLAQGRQSRSLARQEKLQTEAGGREERRLGIAEQEATRREQNIIPELQQLGELQKEINRIAESDPEAANDFIRKSRQSEPVQRMLKKLNLEDVNIFITPDKKREVSGNTIITDKNKRFLSQIGQQILGFDPDIKVGDSIKFSQSGGEGDFQVIGKKPQTGRFRFDSDIGIFDTAEGEIKIPIGSIESITKSKSKKALSDAQSKAFDFSVRIKSGLEVFQDLINKGKSLTSGTIFGTLGREDVKKRRQAENFIINAILRKESGAAISESERKSARETYIPARFDEPGVIRQKLKSIELVMNNFRETSGKTFEPFSIKFSSEDGTRVTTDVGGEKFELVKDSSGKVIGRKKVN